MINIGNRLKFLRREQKLTQKELAEKSGIQIRALQRYEANASHPKYTTMQSISEALQLPVQCFLEHNELIEQHEGYLCSLSQGNRLKLLRICSELEISDLTKSIIMLHNNEKEYMDGDRIVFNKAVSLTALINSIESGSDEISNELAHDISTVLRVPVNLVTYKPEMSAAEIIYSRSIDDKKEKPSSNALKANSVNSLKILLRTISWFNDAGIEKLLDYARDLASMEKYTTPDPDEE
ncbi:MAG: helix-turn-helix transcriptional regulator [Lachnospiraceae bacterium]|nr:helix-turn-helix transcriptional regulator [Lachnospiraceae bacterium]